MTLLLLIVVSAAIAFVTSLSLARLYARTGHGRGWSLVAWLPFALIALGVGVAPFAGMLAAPAELTALAAAIWFGLIVYLAMKRWPTDAGAAPDVFE